jgi:hypothetical protein
VEVLGVQEKRRGYDDCIDIVTVEESAGIVVGLRVGSEGFGFVAMAGVDVGDSNEFDAGDSDDVAHVFLASAARADDSDAYAIICSEDFRGRGERDGGGSGGCGGDEVSAIHFGSYGEVFD